MRRKSIRNIFLWILRPNNRINAKIYVYVVWIDERLPHKQCVLSKEDIKNEEHFYDTKKYEEKRRKIAEK
ncbi:hypothetical protein KPH14_001774 [Odynerus spinipes]|uniref:Uncharacterized protein n=1 Tax=Odynerus spinipes TaxID=1348599 RepID=A0AAD9VWY2_9HYME|nr:hypothetical protein KPH14_001774 [Odynerus spinipes]